MPRRLILFLLLLTLGATQAHAMDGFKRWMNEIKPGTFDVPPENGAESAQLPDGPRKITDAELRVLQDLKARQAELNQKEEGIKRKAQELKILSQQIEQKLDQMRSLQKEIEERRKERKEMDEKDISRMVKYYETMAPENTAVFFNQMDRVTATHILMRMNPRKASAVMQLVEPQVAVEITEMVTRFKADRQELNR